MRKQEGGCFIEQMGGRGDGGGQGALGPHPEQQGGITLRYLWDVMYVKLGEGWSRGWERDGMESP